jgi:branched-chain amino acid transport system ATP-binding protein
VIRLSNVKAVYGGVVMALDDVSLSLPDNGIVVLLGSNGSGKSTTLKTISGVLRTEEGEVTEGAVELDGRRIDRMDPEQIAGMGVRHVLQGRSVFQQLTVEENLLMGAYLRRDRSGVRQDLDRTFDLR